jgi:hypothetical protein
MMCFFQHFFSFSKAALCAIMSRICPHCSAYGVAGAGLTIAEKTFPEIIVAFSSLLWVESWNPRWEFRKLEATFSTSI